MKTKKFTHFLCAYFINVPSLSQITNLPDINSETNPNYYGSNVCILLCKCFTNDLCFDFFF